MVRDKKAYDKKYRENNKEKTSEYAKNYRENNKEKEAERKKIYYENNKEKEAERNKNYLQTENGKKSRRIKQWKRRGIITEDYDFLYYWYMSINNCLNCGVELISGTGWTNHKHLDHCHVTGEPCMVVCGYCNINILK